MLRNETVLSEESLSTAFKYNVLIFVVGLCIEFGPPVMNYVIPIRFGCRRKRLTSRFLSGTRDSYAWSSSMTRMTDLIQEGVMDWKLHHLTKQSQLHYEIQRRRNARPFRLRTPPLPQGNIWQDEWQTVEASSEAEQSSRSSGSSVAVTYASSDIEGALSEQTSQRRLLGPPPNTEDANDGRVAFGVHHALSEDAIRGLSSNGCERSSGPARLVKLPTQEDAGDLVREELTFASSKAELLVQAEDMKRYASSHASSVNYLCFLKVCRNLFFCMSCVSVIFTLPQMHHEKTIYATFAGILGGRISLVCREGSDVHDMTTLGIVLMYFKTICLGIIFFLSIELLQLCCNELPTLNKQAVEQMSRTVWLKWLPKQDWRRNVKFCLSDAEFQRVTMDLRNAIEDKLDLVRSRQHAERKQQEKRARLTTARVTKVLDRTTCREAKNGAQRSSMLLPVKGGVKFLAKSLTRSFRSSISRSLNSNHFGKGRRSTDTITEGHVEHVEVTPVVGEWHRTCVQLLDAYERADAYTRLENSKGKNRLMQKWYARQLRRSRQTAKKLTLNLLKLQLSAKQLCGCAFVTFKSTEDTDHILRSEPPRWWEWRRMMAGYSHFTFGRPPFAAVTLKCEPAPHPDNINWENLEVTLLQRTVRFYGLSLILVFIMVTLGSPKFVGNAIESLIAAMAHKGVRKDEDYGMFTIAVGAVWRFWDYLLSKLSTLVMLTVNSLLLPQLIEWVAAAERSKTKSQMQLRQLRLNFIFLVFNLLLIESLQIYTQKTNWSVEDIPKVAEAVASDPAPVRNHLSFLGNKMSPKYGVFVIHYLFNSTFVTGTIGILSRWRQRLFRLISLSFFATTPRDKLKAYDHELFAWGYWYAWSLSLICITVMMCVVIPGTLFAATLLFFLRYLVDRYNLDNGIQELGSESYGALTQTVVNSMRFIFFMWWLYMGCFFITFQRDEIAPQWLTRFGAYGLIFVGTLIGTASYVVDFYTYWWRKMYHVDLKHRSQSQLSQSDLTRRPSMRPVVPGGQILTRVLVRLAYLSGLSLNAAAKQDFEDLGDPVSWDVTSRTDYIWPDDNVETIKDMLAVCKGGKVDDDFMNMVATKTGLEIQELKSVIDDHAEVDESDSESACAESLGSTPLEIEMSERITMRKTRTL